ncbi:hypothetical protein PQ455_08470 [Sphingomonas naphthae]|uniref:Uncharacterized protein n=1 Tax=Sphingomonas naphthae TaxID=1813468 RepID=A0ABY7TRD1_9SPHN|nr:hypothetical protein [Sphingomonas naphthae]WCT75236.1 hypothetical protein PQ455_08470 [Sphingomonas naphthae]
MPLTAMIMGVMAGAMPIGASGGDVANFDLADVRPSERDVVVRGPRGRSRFLLPEVDEPSRQRAKFRWKLNKVKLRVPIASI